MSNIYQLNGYQTVTIRGKSVDICMAGNVDELIETYLKAQQDGAVPADRSPFGAVLWPSGRAFISYFDSGLLAGELPLPETVVELGCGVGLVSAYFAAVGTAQVLATDYEAGLVVYLKENCKRLCAAMGKEKNQDNVTFMHLDWAAPAPESLKGKVRFLVATDVLYEEEHIKSLPRMARELLHPRGVFYLADPERYRYAAALNELKLLFSDVEVTKIEIDHGESDVKLGTVSTGKSLTTVNILKCSGSRKG